MIFKVGNASEFPTAWKVDCISFFFVPLRVSLFRHFCFTLSMCYSFFVFPSSFLIIYFLIPWDPIHFLTFKQKKNLYLCGEEKWLLRVFTSPTSGLWCGSAAYPLIWHLSVYSLTHLTFRCETPPPPSCIYICNSTLCICTRYNKHIIHRSKCVWKSILGLWTCCEGCN